MKILHTSDWHIGRMLYGQKRYDEFSAFLDWLANLITEQQIDLLLVAGDIFDTTTPSNRAQELYYRFLFNISSSCLRHVVIIAGNHDSPSFLNAPKALLRALNIHVVGSTSKNPANEIILLNGPSDNPEAIVCAVPYLRDRDIRKVTAGETITDKNLKLLEGIRDHYESVFQLAEKKSGSNIPVIGMGHLFAAGGKTMDGDGVRELYVGSLARVGTDIFPKLADYVALGHLHVPQKVGGKEHIRYSGSPIPMGYGEAKQEKSVVVVELNNGEASIDLCPVPSFQVLKKIKGNMSEILKSIEILKTENSTAWLEIEYIGNEIPGNLRQQIEESAEDTGMKILRIKNRRVTQRVIEKGRDSKTLDDLSPKEVFDRLLDTYEVEDQQRPEMNRAHQEILTQIHEEDIKAE